MSHIRMCREKFIESTELEYLYYTSYANVC